MNPEQPENAAPNGDMYLFVDSNGDPYVTPKPIETEDINVCPGCGCMELTTPEHHAMFPEKPNG